MHNAASHENEFDNTNVIDLKANEKEEFYKDQVVKYALELGKKERLHSQKDEEWVKLKESKKDDILDLCHDIEDNICALENLISSTKAKTLEGAFIQLAILSSSTDMCVNGIDEETRNKYLRICARLSYSIKDVLRQHIKIAPEELGVSRYMPDALSPWKNEC